MIFQKLITMVLLSIWLQHLKEKHFLIFVSVEPITFLKRPVSVLSKYKIHMVQLER